MTIAEDHAAQEPRAVELPEDWRVVEDPRFPSRYEVSDRGSVRRIGREQTLHAYRNAQDYVVVQLYEGGGSRTDHRRHVVLVHTLVCAAFHGPRPSEAHRAHVLNGKRWIVRADNVAWMTRAEAWESDMQRSIARHGHLTVTDARQILAAKLLASDGGRVRRGAQVEVASAFGVSSRTVRRAWGREGWRTKPRREDLAAAAACTGLASAGR